MRDKEQCFVEVIIIKNLNSIHQQKEALAAPFDFISFQPSLFIPRVFLVGISLIKWHMVHYTVEECSIGVYRFFCKIYHAYT